MADEYEHDGVIYHEPLPRIVLVNFPPAFNEDLASRGYNSTLCEEDSGPNIGLRFPKPANEVDIILVRDSNAIAKEPGTSQGPARTFHGGGTLKTTKSNMSLFAYRQEVFFRGGICVYFVGASPCNLYTSSGFLNSLRKDIIVYPTNSAFRIVGCEACEELTTFVQRWRNSALAMPGYDDVNLEIEPLIEDAGHNPLSYLLRNMSPEGRYGFVLCLPDYGLNIEIIDQLLSQVLPALAPHLFPFRHDLSWLAEQEFQSSGISALESQKVAVRQEAMRKLDSLDAQIVTIRDQDQYLTDLLTCDGDKLKLAIKKALEVLLTCAGLGVPVLDVDSDPTLRDGATQKREDLRIEYAENVLLLNVTGREQFLRPTSLNQISRHHRLFLEAPTRHSGKPHSLLIANHNYGKGLDPRKRGQLFGSGTAEAEQRLQSEGHGAMSSWDLFRLVRAAQSNGLVLTLKNLTELFTTVGILEFNSFQTKLSAKV